MRGPDHASWTTGVVAEVSRAKLPPRPALLPPRGTLLPPTDAPGPIGPRTLDARGGWSAGRFRARSSVATRVPSGRGCRAVRRAWRIRFAGLLGRRTTWGTRTA